MHKSIEDEAEEGYAKPRRFRLIPLTVTMLALLFVMKVNDLYIGSRQLQEFYSVRSAQAASKQEPTSGEKAQVIEDTAVAEAKQAEEAAAEGAEKADGHGTAKKPEEEPKTFGTGKSTIKEIEALKAKETTPKFSQNELDLLENLAKRRDELDVREKDTELKAKVLEATQKRIDDKLTEMKALESQLSQVVALYNEKQNAQIASLVKIYESMKPIQAAAIFNELDLTILLEVIDKMSERKVAPVLALMDPKKARDVTQELAAMRKTAPKVPPAAASGK